MAGRSGMAGAAMTQPNRAAGDPPEPQDGLPVSPLARLRLLVALDALLVEGSVSGAAASLGLSTPAMSRMLGQLRTMYGDDLLRRAGGRMVPTARAGELRLRLRALVSDAEALMRPDPAPAPAPPLKLGIPQHPPLARQDHLLPEGQPDSATITRHLFSIGHNHPPQERLARYIATIGAGRGRTRPLDETEAADAFGIVLDGEADPIQIGALLVALQYRGVTTAELVGMARAARRGFPPPTGAEGAPDLDWPAYRSPRNRRPPWFLLAAKLLAGGGHRVLLHGFSDGLFDPVLKALDIPVALSLPEARAALSQGSCAFLPLSAIEPQVQALLNLYRLFEMRAPVNLVVQLLNPLGAGASVFGVPSAGNARLHGEAAAQLGWSRSLSVESHRDVAQATPHRMMKLVLTRGAEAAEIGVPPGDAGTPQSQPPGYDVADLCYAVWSGALRDPAALGTVLDTAALGLMAISAEGPDMAEARRMAAELWERRSSAQRRV
ncbi:glycosyl transferase family protein [Cereibacter changlensis]|nr:glycosyl transferase family protein [Cereibacter changlensis]